MRSACRSDVDVTSVRAVDSVLQTHAQSMQLHSKSSLLAQFEQMHSDHKISLLCDENCLRCVNGAQMCCSAPAAHECN